MKKILTIAVVAIVLTVMADPIIKYISQYPKRPIPGDGDMWLLEDAGEPAGQHNYVSTTTTGILAYVQLHQTTIPAIVTNNYFTTTNLTIQFPGGATNLNLTPLSLMWSDVNDAEASIPNASGVLTNNGSGGIGFSQTLSLNEIDTANFYPTNLYTGLTNYTVLGTDANGLLTLGSSTLTNVTITNLYAQTITNNTFVNTNVVIVSGKATINTLIITNTSFVNSPTNQSATPSTVAYYASDRTLGSVANAYGILTNDGSGAAAFTSTYPQGNGTGITNLTYRYITNNSGTTTLNWGQAYRTNIAANVTIALASPGAAFYESTVYWVTNSSASDRTVTGPSGCIGPVGTGTPSVMTATNKTITRFLFEHYGPSDITVSKTDYGN